MEPSSLILLVDRNRRNLELLGQFLARAGYQSRAAVNLQEFDTALEHILRIALALIDVAGFDRSIWTRCAQLRQAAIPFLVISPRHLAAVQQESLTYGARGVLVKPLAVKELLALLRHLLET